MPCFQGQEETPRAGGVDPHRGDSGLDPLPPSAHPPAFWGTKAKKKGGVRLKKAAKSHVRGVGVGSRGTFGEVCLVFRPVLKHFGQEHHKKPQPHHEFCPFLLSFGGVFFWGGGGYQQNGGFAEGGRPVKPPIPAAGGSFNPPLFFFFSPFINIIFFFFFFVLPPLQLKESPKKKKKANP